MDTAWNEIVGHEWAVRLLREAIARGRVGHAYLFTGPRHVGKTALAIRFAQALNCEVEAADRRPCGQCRSCRLIAAGRHPDVRVVEPEESSRGHLTLKIEQIRDLQQGLSLAAYEARWKIALLTEFDSATAGAANAFLKTLEEPPNGVALLLTASEADAVLPTISSRCRVIALRPLPTGHIASALEARWQVPVAQAHLLAHLADGRLGWALQALEDKSLLTSRGEHLDRLQEALYGSRVERFELADKLARKPEELPGILRTWLSWWRDLALLAWSGTDGAEVGAISNVDAEDDMVSLSRRWERASILRALQQTDRALWQLEHNANTRLALENLLLVYPRRGV
ncbi:MAG: DNA polymerase III subunit delta' [Anaerolineae bacterium]|nr:DNA polymerase III subunit delta' [Anaerolineae bacterium]